MEWPVLGRSRARRSNDTLMAARQRQEDQKFNAGYEEAQSRLRMSMCCKSLVHPIQTPLQTRVVDLAHMCVRPLDRFSIHHLNNGAAESTTRQAANRRNFGQREMGAYRGIDCKSCRKIGKTPHAVPRKVSTQSCSFAVETPGLVQTTQGMDN